MNSKHYILWLTPALVGSSQHTHPILGQTSSILRVESNNSCLFVDWAGFALDRTQVIHSILCKKILAKRAPSEP